MTKQQILQTALRQSALDLNAAEDDFLKSENVFVPSCIGPQARRYYQSPVPCNLVSYGRNIVTSAEPEYEAIVREYITGREWYRCFETPALLRLDERMRPLGQRVCFMAEYFLPDPDKVKELPCALPVRLLEQNDFAGLYAPEWSNALCEQRRELDVLGVGAYDNGRLIALAACSADCDTMWQIGVDVLPEYRRQGIASALTSRLALEILARGKVPFYCCAWSNLPSARNAIRSGFAPAWTELTVKPQSTADSLMK